MEPFRIINRDLSGHRGQVYMVECEKWNGDRDSYVLRRVFLDLESAREYQMELWASELKTFSDFTDWSSTSIPAGKTVQDYVIPRLRAGIMAWKTNSQSSREYIGWDIEALIDDSIMTDDDFSEMNWDSDYGFTMGYSLLTLKWDAERNRYG